LIFLFLLDSRHGPWRKRWWPVFGRVASVAAGFLVPILFFEVVYGAFLFAAHDVGVKLPYKTYLQQLYGRYKLVTVAHHAGPRIGQVVHSPYPGYLHAMEGIVWLVVMSAAIIFIAIRWKREHVLALLFALGPVLLASSSIVAAPRYMSLSVPGIALAAGFALAAITAHGHVIVKGAGIVLLLSALASSLVALPQVLSIQAAWDPALNVAHSQGGALISPKGYSLATYVGVHNVRLGWKESLAWARQQRASGARWAVLELFVRPGAQVTDPSAVSVIAPVGELSRFLTMHLQPLVSERFRTQGFIYEGMPPHTDRLILLYDLNGLPPA
ncbi:MAG: hypothetical protein ACXVES_02480, partial [Actinomycetota bacterium]